MPNRLDITAATPSDGGADTLAQRLAARFADLPSVVAVALGGSTATGFAADGSDLDLYVYARADIPVTARAAIVGPDAGRPELDQRFWEPGDTWVDPDTGRTIDVMYRHPDWIEDQLARVLLRHEASIGYSTALWHNVLTSRPLFDRDGWFARLQAWADQPYPGPLRRAIIAKNHPLLRDRSFAFLPQIEAALRRNDAVAVQHRLTAFLASFFDLLFALNRVPHPGEKRLVEHALASCPLRPDDLAPRLDALVAAASPPCDQPALIARLGTLVDDLDRLLEAANVGTRSPQG